MKGTNQLNNQFQAKKKNTLKNFITASPYLDNHLLYKLTRRVQRRFKLESALFYTAMVSVEWRNVFKKWANRRTFVEQYDMTCKLEKQFIGTKRLKIIYLEISATALSVILFHTNWWCSWKQILVAKLKLSAFFYRVAFFYNDGTWRLLFLAHCSLCFQWLLKLYLHHVEHCYNSRTEKNSIIADDFKSITPESVCFWSWCRFNCPAFIHRTPCYDY